GLGAQRLVELCQGCVVESCRREQDAWPDERCEMIVRKIRPDLPEHPVFGLFPIGSRIVEIARRERHSEAAVDGGSKESSHTALTMSNETQPVRIDRG